MTQSTLSEAEIKARALKFKESWDATRDEIARVIVGQKNVVEGVMVAMFCGGNVLLEGVPGLGKTELVKALSRVLQLDFNRIQFTPDLMPADVVGTNVMNEDSHGNYQLEFRKGPVFTQLLLADEINRATPKTQSAMLETMQERTVTVGGKTYEMKKPFFVMATQNPLEQEGTYPLPEAQLDRFMFKLIVPFLNRDELNEVVSRTIIRKPIDVSKILDSEAILELQELTTGVVVADPIRDFSVRLTLATHPGTPYAPDEVSRFVAFGASPRAAQSLIKAARVRALSQGRVHISFDDIRHFAVPVLNHRTILNYDGQAEGIDTEDLIRGLCVKVPENA